MGWIVHGYLQLHEAMREVNGASLSGTPGASPAGAGLRRGDCMRLQAELCQLSEISPLLAGATQYRISIELQS
jgi:hypothetical protein